MTFGGNHFADTMHGINELSHGVDFAPFILMNSFSKAKCSLFTR